MKPVRTLVLVSGERDARFFLNDGLGKGLTEALTLAAAQFADVTAEPADAPTRGVAPGGAHFGVDSATSPGDRQRALFADRVIEALGQEWAGAAPDRLVIAAPPKMLGLLRARLSGAAKAALAADLDKDLVHLAARDLAPHLDGILVA